MEWQRSGSEQLTINQVSLTSHVISLNCLPHQNMDDGPDALFQEELADLAAGEAASTSFDRHPRQSVNDTDNDEFHDLFHDLFPDSVGEAASAPLQSAGDELGLGDLFREELGDSIAGEAVGPSSEAEAHVPIRCFAQRPGQGKGKGGGRPRGARLMRQVASANREESDQQLADPAAVPGTIEYARRYRQRKVEERQAHRSTLSSREATMTVFGRFEIVANIGTRLQQQLRQATQHMMGRDLQPDSFLEHQFHTPSTTMSFRQLNAFVEVCNSSVRVVTVASAMLEAANFLWGVFMATMCLFFGSAGSRAEPICMMVKMRYDETPTKARDADLSEGLPQQGSDAVVPRPQAAFAQRTGIWSQALLWVHTVLRIHCAGPRLVSVAMGKASS